MSMTTFDTLKFAQRLERTGLDPQQAVAFSEAQKEAFDQVFDSQVATKADMIKLDTKINLVHWMIGFNLAFTFAMFWKMFIG